MALRNIIINGDPILKKKSRPVTNFDERLHVLLDDMWDSLHEAEGVGLAAVQVGVLRRAVVIELEEGKKLELINPEITEQSGEVNAGEGCLSVPELYGMVLRPEKITFKAQDRHGKEYTMKVDDLEARAVCHELDHLEGIIFTDFVTEYIDKEDMER